MKFRVLGTAAFLLMTSAVYGQRFNVPFAFHVGQKTLAAGTYNVSVVNTSGLLMIRPQAGEAVQAMPQSAVQAATIPDKGKMVFHRYGNTYFLSQIWRGGREFGSQLKKTGAEREMAKSRTPGEETSVFASLR